MKDWERIRLARTDLTDYVVHFTKRRHSFIEPRDFPERPAYATSEQVFREILNEGHIKPSFAKIRSLKFGTTANTVRGPVPAVCLTEQPLSAVLNTRSCAGSRYSGFGVAYHKYALYQQGARPVIYASKDVMGRRLALGEVGFEEGKDIYTDGLPLALQYLWVQYKPTIPYWNDHPVDFTWEREWRYRCSEIGLPILLERSAHLFKSEVPVGALIVERDSHLDSFRSLLASKAEAGCSWASKLKRIVSLETAQRMLAMGDHRYARIETWPE